MNAHDLLDPQFVAQLEALKRRLLPRVRSGRTGERTAKRRGGTAEFAEHRPYSPGDDLRRIDWLAYARTGQPLLKTFHADEDALVRLLVDSSRSVGFGTPSKFEVEQRLAAAFGYLSLAASARVQVVVGKARGPLPAEMRPARKGRAALGELLRELSALGPDGRFELHEAVDHIVRRSDRPGVLVVLSDFFEPGPLMVSLGRAAAAGHDVRLVQVLTRDELSPGFEGDLTLVDSETGDEVDVTMDAAAMDAYVQRLAALVGGLRAFARTRGATYLRVTTDDSLEDVCRRFVARAVD